MRRRHLSFAHGCTRSASVITGSPVLLARRELENVFCQVKQLLDCLVSYRGGFRGSGSVRLSVKATNVSFLTF